MKTSRAKDKNKLTNKEVLFCDHYLKDFNGTQAYKKAYPNCHSDVAAAAQAYRVLRKPQIDRYLQERKLQILNDIGVSKESVLVEMARLGFSNISDYLSFGPDGVTLKDSSGMTREKLAAIAEASETTTKDGGTIRFKMHDKKGALDSLGEHVGLFQKKNGNGNTINIFPVVRIPQQKSA
jgi:phage terminase small subunit